MRSNIKSVILGLLFGALISSPSFAHDSSAVATEGGLMVGSNSDPYWFQISGVLKLDERLFTGDTQPTRLTSAGGAGTYNSGAFIRDAGLTLNGGVGQDFSYTLALDFDAKDKELGIDDAFLTYYGFRNLMPNFSVSVGQVVPGFCLTCAASSKWIPFLERSMGTNTFGPQQGMGVNANSYDNNYSATVAITQQPKMGSKLKTLTGQQVPKARDLWQASGRFTYAPISQPAKVLQFGFSGHIQEYSNYGLQFRPMPEMRSGGNSTSLLNTANPITGGLIAAKNQKTIDFDVLFIKDSWSGELEYQQAFVARDLNLSGVKQGPNLTFKGYHAQISYILTGESRPLKKSNGTLGQIKPCSKRGAWEVSGRYSYIGLNNKDINGGMAHNTSASLSWYANNNIKVIGEYVYSKQSRRFPNYNDRRHVGGIGARLQIVF